MTELDGARTDFEANLKRVRDMLALYKSLKPPGQKGRRKVGETDVLRAAVVFLHATMEELLRDLSRWKWADNPQVLATLPLPDKLKTEKKFTLESLHAHAGKTVRDLIQESVEYYLHNYQNYNDTGQVAGAVGSLGVDVNDVNAKFDDLQSMIKRRHHIVHRGDRNEADGQGHHKAKTIRADTVEGWIDAVEAFGTALMAKL